MVTRLKKVDPVVTDQIDDAVFLGQTAGPGACGNELEWLRFADAGKRIMHDRLDKVESPECHLAVGFHPIPQVFAEFLLEDRLSLFSLQGRPRREARRPMTVPPRS